VLVTGGASFIGSHLAEALVEKGPTSGWLTTSPVASAGISPPSATSAVRSDMCAEDRRGPN
jgi:nucleoside-diphosphate-sugar epimerase